MSPQKLLSLLSRIATVVFGLLIIYGVYWVIVFFVSVYDGGFDYPLQWKPFFNLQHIGLPVKELLPGEMYSSDSLVRYTVNTNSYNVVFKPRSPIGYYAFFSVVISLTIMLLIARTFIRVFKQLNLGRPFDRQLTRQLIQLARLYIVLGAFDLTNYFMLSSLLTRSFTYVNRRFDLSDLIINNFIFGVIIWIIAIIFQRGIELQEENALTV